MNRFFGFRRTGVGRFDIVQLAVAYGYLKNNNGNAISQNIRGAQPAHLKYLGAGILYVIPISLMERIII